MSTKTHRYQSVQPLSSIGDCALQNGRYSHRRHALTLVESLIALSLGAMVVAIVSAVTVQTLRTQSVTQRVLEAQWERVRLFDLFEGDVRAMIPQLPDEEQYLSFEGERGTLLSMVCLVPTDDSPSPWPRRIPARVTYRKFSAADGNAQLVREVSFLSSESAPTANIRGATANRTPTRRVLATGLKEIRLEAFYSGRWNEVLARPQDQEVEGLRLGCRWDDGHRRHVRGVRILGADQSQRSNG